TASSPMNFCTVPSNRAISSVMASKKARSTSRRSSGSSLVASSVDAARSAKRTVTTLRSSSSASTTGAASGVRGLAQLPQNRNEAGEVAPQAGQVRSMWEPQVPQKRKPGGLARPQEGQATSELESGRWSAIVAGEGVYAEREKPRNPPEGPHRFDPWAAENTRVMPRSRTAMRKHVAAWFGWWCVGMLLWLLFTSTV